MSLSLCSDRYPQPLRINQCEYEMWKNNIYNYDHANNQKGISITLSRVFHKVLKQKQLQSSEIILVTFFLVISHRTYQTLCPT